MASQNASEFGFTGMPRGEEIMGIHKRGTTNFIFATWNKGDFSVDGSAWVDDFRLLKYVYGCLYDVILYSCYCMMPYYIHVIVRRLYSFRKSRIYLFV